MAALAFATLPLIFVCLRSNLNVAEAKCFMRTQFCRSAYQIPASPANRGLFREFVTVLNPSQRQGMRLPWTENPCVGSSILPLATSNTKGLLA